ncbi:hypothetical protein HZ326_1732 [Fusarium oxysporum f. sp. albedinis]|nr:hypothetical protein HZ326_1732 [Fusarium oxysporum f. sp. albedinis]
MSFSPSGSHFPTFRPPPSIHPSWQPQLEIPLRKQTKDASKTFWYRKYSPSATMQAPLVSTKFEWMEGREGIRGYSRRTRGHGGTSLILSMLPVLPWELSPVCASYFWGLV